MVETLFNGGMVNLRRLLLADNCIAQVNSSLGVAWLHLVWLRFAWPGLS